MVLEDNSLRPYVHMCANAAVKHRIQGSTESILAEELLQSER